jgi:O-acetylhomoserine (thiol)-lyase
MTTGQPADSAQAFATRQLHAGDSGANAHHSRTTPIYLTAGFSFDDFDEARDRFAGAEGFTYTRIGNPTNSALEKRVAALEGGVEAILVGSGQAALTVALLGLLQAGDELVSASSIYEGSRGLFNDNFSRFGIATAYVDDANDADAWHAAITPRTRAIFVESIPNPKNDVVDIALVAEIAHAAGIPVVVDNTFATPYLLRPFEHGADIVVHSASKFLAGHGSVIGGIVVDGGLFDWAAHADRFPHLAAPATGLAGASHIDVYGRGAYGAFARNTVASRLGPTPSPLNAFLIQQGVETLSLRVERQSANALAVAEWLDAQEEIESVDYSGLPGNPYHALAQRYLPDGQGSVFSFTVAGGLEAARAFINAVDIFTRMSHLGDVRSLILHPASTSHTARTAEELVTAGIGAGLLRVSIGIEDVRDLIADLEVGLAAARLAVADPATPLALILEG